MTGVRDLSKDEIEQETRIYRFLHQINIVRDTAKRLLKKGPCLGIQMKAEKGDPLQMEFRQPDIQTATELAVVIEPLVRKSSDIHYDAILELCRSQNESAELVALHEKATTEVAGIKEGGMQLVHNNQERTPEWVYERFMDKMVNVGDIEAREYEESLNRDPILRDLLLFQFYGYSMNMIRFLIRLQETLKLGNSCPKARPGTTFALLAAAQAMMFTSRRRNTRCQRLLAIPTAYCPVDTAATNARTSWPRWRRRSWRPSRLP